MVEKETVQALIHITKDQRKALKKLAFDTELPMSEHIRRAIDRYLKDIKKEG